MTDEGTFPKSDGDILHASEVNRFENHIWNELVYVSTRPKSILAHSATNWCAVNATSTKITSDSGVTWTDSTADIADMDGVSKVCDADKTKAISCDYNSINISITADSGDNWASASTDPVDITRVLDLSFPTATVAVVACDFGTADSGIFYSTDAGDTWDASDFPAADCDAIDMVDGSNGIAIHADGSIYTTADGGTTWADSGQGVVAPGAEGQSTIIALTSTTGIYLNSSGTTIQTFNTTSGGTTRLTIPDASQDTGFNWLSNLVKTTNGNIYFMQYILQVSLGAETKDLSRNGNLFKSEDNGATWSVRTISLQLSGQSTLRTNDTRSQMVEYDTNKLLFRVGDNQLMKIDER